MSLDLHVLRAGNRELDVLASSTQGRAAGFAAKYMRNIDTADQSTAAIPDAFGIDQSAAAVSLDPCPGWTEPHCFLVTGSSGYLGATLVLALRQMGVPQDRIVGVDVVAGVAGTTTHANVSVADRAALSEVIYASKCDFIFHTAALHAPHAWPGVHEKSEEDFMLVNVRGTSNVLELAREVGALGIVHTSTTSLMATEAVRQAENDPSHPCVFLNEACDGHRGAPRNKYGRSKLIAEQLCAHSTALDKPSPSVYVLRTSRFFVEEALEESDYKGSSANAKVNELLGRRVALQDVVTAHLLAARTLLNFPQTETYTRPVCRIFTLSAPCPFSKDDALDLKTNATRILESRFPRCGAIFRRYGWQLPAAVRRVYESARATREHADGGLGWRPVITFQSVLELLDQQSSDVDEWLLEGGF